MIDNKYFIQMACILLNSLIVIMLCKGKFSPIGTWTLKITSGTL
jgi:hypothetical protein